MLEGDFELRLIPKINGVYATRNRVIPNIDGIFPIPILNIASPDIHSRSRKSIGYVQPVSVSVASISMDAKDTFNINDITRGNNLSAAENTHLMSLLTD